MNADDIGLSSQSFCQHFLEWFIFKEALNGRLWYYVATAVEMWKCGIMQ